MLRHDRFRARHLLSGLALCAVVPFLLTPLGPWLTIQVGRQLAPGYGWLLGVGEVGGSYLGTVRLAEVRLVDAGADSAQSTSITIGQLSLSPWSYAAKAEALDIQIGASGDHPSQPDADDGSVPSPLSLSYLPEITVSDGRVRLERVGGGFAMADSIELSYHAQNGGGVLTLSKANWTYSGGGEEEGAISGSASSRFTILPREIEARALRLVCQLDSLEATLDGTALMRVEAGFPLEAAGDLELASADTSTAQARVRIGGLLTPLNLDMQLDGRGSSADWGPVAVAANVALRPDTVLVDELVAEMWDGRIEVSGSYALTGAKLDLDLRAEGVALQRWTGSDVGGRLGGRGRLQGGLTDRRYSADLDILLSDVRLGDKAFDFEVEAHLDRDNAVRVDVASILLGKLRAEGELDPHGPYQLGLSGTLNPQPLVGIPSAPILVRGEVRPDSIAAHFTMDRLPVPDRDFGPLEADLLWNGRRDRLDLRLALEEDQVEIRLSMDATASRVDTLVTVIKPLSMGRLLPDLSGTVEGRVEGGGGGAEGTRLAGGLYLSNAAYRGWHTGPLYLEVSHVNGRAQLNVRGAGFEGRAYADSLVAYGGDFRFEESEFHYLAPGTAADTSAALELSGLVNWKGRLDGSAGPAAEVDLQALNLSGGDWQVVALQPVEAVLEYGLVQLQPVSFSTPAGPLNLSGVAGADSVDLVADLAAINLKTLTGELQGTGSASVRLGGSPAQIQGSGSMTLTDVALAGRDLGELSVQISLGDSLAAVLSLDQATNPGPELTFDLDADAGVFGAGPDSSSSRFHLAMRADGLDLTPILAYVLADSGSGVLDAGGDLHGAIEPGGAIAWEEASGALQFDRLEILQAGLRLGLSSGGQLRFGEGGLWLEELAFVVEVDDGDRVREGGKVLFEGAMERSGAMSRSGLNDLSLVLEDLDLSAIELLGVGGLPVGTIDLDARLTGSEMAPQLELSFFCEMVDLGELSGSAQADSSRVEMEANWSTVIGDEAEVAAQLPWDWRLREFYLDQGVLKLSSEGVNLLMFLDQMPELEDVDGIVAMDLELRGFDSGAEIYGSIDISDLYLRMIDIKPGYLFPSGAIEFAGKRGQLRGFAGGPKGGDGRAELSGEIELDPSTGVAYSLRLEGEDVPFNFDDVFDVPRIDLDLTLAGTATGTRISGRSLLEGASIDLPLIDLNAPPVPPPPPAVQDPFLRETELDLQVDILDLHVENEITNVDAEGSIRVYGTFYKPLFQGEVLINQGKLFVLNNEFDIQRGRISLDRLVPSYSILEIAYDPLRLNPELDLGAVTTVTPIDEDEEYQITFLLEGPARQVVPRFESEPPMEDKELLMLVAFGSRQNAMALFEEENRRALYSVAGQLLLSRQVKKIGLDEFQLLPSGTILETVGQPAMHIGKYVKWPLPLWLRYEGLTNDMSLGELRLEYKVRPYLTITGTSQSEQERYGLGMGIEKDF